MLILARREGERIRIGDDIVVTLVQSARGKSRIGIEAPGGVAVHREEIYDQIGATTKGEALRECQGVAATERTETGELLGLAWLCSGRIASRGMPSLTPDGLLMGWSDDGTQRQTLPGLVGKYRSFWLWRSEDWT